MYSIKLSLALQCGQIAPAIKRFLILELIKLIQFPIGISILANVKTQLRRLRSITSMPFVQWQPGMTDNKYKI
jgi:hypothetical protein